MFVLSLFYLFVQIPQPPPPESQLIHVKDNDIIAQNYRDVIIQNFLNMFLLVVYISNILQENKNTCEKKTDKLLFSDQLQMHIPDPLLLQLIKRPWDIVQ